MNIEITFAKNNKQAATIDGKHYEFEFSEKELAEDIEMYYFTEELRDMSGLSFDSYSTTEMAEHISEEWNYVDVERLIKSFITENPANLIDHLQIL